MPVVCRTLLFQSSAQYHQGRSHLQARGRARSCFEKGARRAAFITEMLASIVAKLVDARLLIVYGFHEFDEDNMNDVEDLTESS